MEIHESAHAINLQINPKMDGSSLIEREFSNLAGLASSNWIECAGLVEYWADAYDDCAWHGMTASSDMVTPNYKFKIKKDTYNSLSKFFIKVLSGPDFIPANSKPPGSIPQNFSNSPECGIRNQSQVEACGTDPSLDSCTPLDECMKYYPKCKPVDVMHCIHPKSEQISGLHIKHKLHKSNIHKKSHRRR
ncbi:MAG: hypothetical protein NVS1B10_04350 [Candidatus Saccharimonadales bacterium]